LVEGVGNNDTNSVEVISIAQHKRAGLPSIAVPSVTIHCINPIQSIKTVTCEGN
jgi:hypothetical protein